MHFIISSDYAQSMIPGWKDSIFPVFYSLTGFQVALGTCLMILYVMRRWGGFQEYYGKSVFWSASKVQLGLTLLWAYHLFAFFITYWYGRLVVEQNIIKYLFAQSYGGVFVANLALSFAIPFLLLLWNPVRRSAWGPPLAGLSAALGALMFSVRVFVGGANSGNIYAAFPGSRAGGGLPRYLGHLHGHRRHRRGRVHLPGGDQAFCPSCRSGKSRKGRCTRVCRRFIRGEYLVLAKPE